MLQIKMRSR